MEFDHGTLMKLADQFEKKAEQLLETAESIRETASIMSPKIPRKTAEPDAEPDVEPQELPIKPPVHDWGPQPGYASQTLQPHEQSIEIEESQPIAPKTTQKEWPTDCPPMFSQLEQHVLNALDGHVAGLEIAKIVGKCKQGGMGTKGSVQFALGKLTKRGFITRLDRGRYAIPTAFNTVDKKNNTRVEA